VAVLTTPQGWLLFVLLPGALTCASIIRWIWSRQPQVATEGARVRLA
jgi:hypothetical protein